MGSAVVAIAASVVYVGGSTFEPSRTGSHLPEGKWISLFNGQDLSEWYQEQPNHGTWRVDDGVLTVERTDEYKSFLTDKVYGPGTVRATIIPAHDGARLGIGYLCPRGPLFMLMGDKYTWLRGYCKDCPRDLPDRWRSFPGPIPRAGERVELEIEYGPDRVLLSVDGTVLQELPGVEGEGHIALHVWKDDAGGFTDIEFRPTVEQ